VAVDDERLVTVEQPGVAVQVEVGDDVEIIALFFLPSVSESLAAHEVRIANARRAITHARPGHWPRHTQPKFISGLAVRVIPIKTVRRRICRIIGLPAGEPVAGFVRTFFANGVPP
jgi:hypothetical protein